MLQTAIPSFVYPTSRNISRKKTLSCTLTQQVHTSTLTLEKSKTETLFLRWSRQSVLMTINFFCKMPLICSSLTLSALTTLLYRSNTKYWKRAISDRLFQELQALDVRCKLLGVHFIKEQYHRNNYSYSNSRTLYLNNSNSNSNSKIY